MKFVNDLESFVNKIAERLALDFWSRLARYESDDNSITFYHSDFPDAPDWTPEMSPEQSFRVEFNFEDGWVLELEEGEKFELGFHMPESVLIDRIIKNRCFLEAA